MQGLYFNFKTLLDFLSILRFFIIFCFLIYTFSFSFVCNNFIILIFWAFSLPFFFFFFSSFCLFEDFRSLIMLVAMSAGDHFDANNFFNLFLSFFFFFFFNSYGHFKTIRVVQIWSQTHLRSMHIDLSNWEKLVSCLILAKYS